MTRTIQLSEEEKELLQAAFTSANNAMAQAQTMLDFANARKKGFEDLVAMYCLTNGLEKTKVKLDPQTWTIFYDEKE